MIRKLKYDYLLGLKKTAGMEKELILIPHLLTFSESSLCDEPVLLVSLSSGFLK
jgi:hypothetical protein